MKFLAWFIGVMASLVLLIYVVAFTSLGNGLLKPIVEAKIQEQTKLQSKLKTFQLSMSDFEILLELNKNNTILLKGNYSLFSQAFNIAYRVNLEELKTLKPLTQTQLNSSLYTDGTVVGDMAFVTVDGKSDVGKSDTTYHVELTDFNPTSIIAKVKNADLKSLLYMGNQKEYASAKINLDVNFKNITPHKLDGNILLVTQDGSLNSSVMKNDFNITIPQTAFSMSLKAALAGDNVDYTYALNSNLAKLNSSGEVTPEPLALNITYGVDVKELAVFKPITGADVRGALRLSGSVKGNKEAMKVDGRSDVAKSDTTYHVELKDFNPTSIIAKVKNADLKSLLYMGNQKEYASAKINLDVNFKNITPHKLDGNILLITQDGELITNVMKKDFNINIPATAFTMSLKAALSGDDVDYTYILNSNLAKLNSSGKVTPEPLALNIKYGVDVKELAVLKPITGADIRGALRLSGKVQGSKEAMKVDGRSDFAGSDTQFVATLKEFQPATAKATIKNMKLQKVLYMVKQPHFADGLFSLNADITDLRSDKLKGLITSSVTKGLVDSKYMTKAYEFKSQMPRTTFSAKTETQLKGNLADTKVSFVSNLANFDIKQARFNLADTSLVSDYLLKVHNLDKLYFATDRHLKGSLSAHGELKKAKDLDFSAFSNIAGGKLDAKLHNDDFVANIDSMQTLEILDMLIYPEIFQSSIDGLLNYNLLTEKGRFTGKISDGKFTKNSVLDLAKQYAKTDMYKEKFIGNVEANINKENIVAALNLKSNTSSIKTVNTQLNSKTKKINSKLDINANGNPLVIKLTGSANAPKVDIDAQKLIQREAEKAIQKEASKYLKGLF